MVLRVSVGGIIMPIWKDSFAIGVPAIDRQHKELFARADGLLAAMREGRSAPECKRLLAFLREYCETHFGSEESLMQRIKYPGLAAHFQQHLEFKRRFEESAEDFAKSGANSVVAIELQGLIGGWLVNHICREDAQLAGVLGDRRLEVSL